MLVGTMQDELPPPAKVRATDFSIAAIMARSDRTSQPSRTQPIGMFLVYFFLHNIFIENSLNCSFH